MKELNVNFRSIVNNIYVFQTLIDTEKPDILTGTETWLSSDINSSEFMPDGYTVFRQDRIGRDKRSGGFLILTKSNIICSHQPNLTTN